MRTTLKRGLGQTGSNGNGKAVFPPGAVTPMTRYRQPPPPRPGRIRQILAWGFASILMLVGGIAGGAYLFFHHEVSNVQAHTAAVKIAAKKLDVPLPGQPTVALVICPAASYARAPRTTSRVVPSRLWKFLRVAWLKRSSLVHM